MKTMLSLAATLVVSTAFAAPAAKNPEPHVAMPRTAAPTVDGVIGAEEWADAVRMDGFCTYRKDEIFPADASFMVKQDGERVYIAGSCIVPPDGLVRKVMPRAGGANVFVDDCYEIVFFDDVELKTVKASHLYVNFNGAMMSHSRTGSEDAMWKAWETVETKSTIRDGMWEIEVSVPFSDIGFTAANARQHGLRICRNWWHADDTAYSVQTSWSQCDGPFLSVDRAPRVEFRDDAPVVRCERMGKNASGNVYEAVFSVFNPGKAALSVKGLLRGAPANSQPADRRETFAVAPGARKEFALKGPVLNDEAVAFAASFDSASGDANWYSRRFSFAPNGPRIRFRPKGGAAEASFQFAFFPSYNKARIAADVSNCRGKEKVTALKIEVSDAKGKVLATRDLGMKDGAADTIVDLPDLASATRASGSDDYEVKLVAEGAPEIKASLKFKRGVFEWEGNKFGLSDAVPAPFEKVKVQRFGGLGSLEGLESCKPVELERGSVVKVVLRDYTIGDCGLWKQVNAAGKDILARPMTLRTSQTSQTFQTSQTYDVDGLMDWRLTLKPGHYEPMALEIPLKAEFAKLYHACADTLRSNPAGAIPAGTGRVWDSSLVAHASIIGDYLPYIWFGGPLRGIAVYGENDRGWETNGKTPCQEFVREADGTVVLKLNLIQRPVDLTEERTIHIGFQATPVKPMLENWRGMDNGVLMASWNVYGVSAEELSPYDGKDTFLRKMGEARRTGKVDQEYVENYIRSYPSPWPEGSEKRKERDDFLSRHWRSGMNRSAMSHKTGDLHVFYTNPRGVPLGMPPGTTYADEWDRQQWTVRGGNREAGHAYDNDPVASYRDYAAFWYRKMIETGAADALYWDNVFCQSDFNLVGTEAYRHPCGDIQPSSGIFNMRALIRRAAMTLAELGKTPWNNWVHMTNTGMAPISAFAGVHYDWEDTAGDSPIQERYTREYIQAVSIGRQFGVRPMVIGYFAVDFVQDKDLKKQAWLHHTGVGACLTHELEWRRVPEWQAANKALVAWGYRKPETKVWNYWDEDVPFPAEIKGPKNAALAMAKDGEAIVVVSDWEKGGAYAIRPDCAALGLSKDFKAYDFESGAELSVKDGSVALEIPHFDYRIIRFK